MSDKSKSRFWRISSAGILFQGGTAAVDSSTIVATLVHGLTGSAVAVGAASAILRCGWLMPQIFVGFLAQRQQARMPFYIFGAFGRALCLIALAAALAGGAGLDGGALTVLFFILWTAYAFVSGVVAVPYNDIVARSVAASRRSRLLAIRFFGGGVLAIGVAAAADRFLNSLSFPGGYAAIVLLGGVLMLLSSAAFVSAGEPDAPPSTAATDSFADFLRGGIAVYRVDRRFRHFVHAQWLGGAALMALPFYILQARALDGDYSRVAMLLGAQTAGALLSNALWGWWGDSRGKRSLYEGMALLRTLPPLLTIVWVLAVGGTSGVGFVAIFFLLGAVGNGTTIAMLGFLMEISPDDRRPAYSGYFNALVAPAALLPLLGALIVETVSLTGVFAVALAAAIVQFLVIRRI